MESREAQTSWNVPEYPLLHPVPLFALATLVMNDHVLKQHYPGWVTGKLSDVAGMVFFPLFLVALIDIGCRLFGAVQYRRNRVFLVCACALSTAMVFCAVKTWAPATEFYEVGLGLLQWPLRAGMTILGGASPDAETRVVLVRDVTDLVAVPFVGISILIGNRGGSWKV